MGRIRNFLDGFVAKSDNNHEKLMRLAAEDGVLPRRRVDMKTYVPVGLFGKFKAWRNRVFIPLLMPVFRLCGVRKFFGIYWVARDAEVRAVLNDHTAFNVPYGPEMEQITKGVTFCLGDDGELHERQLNALKEAWAKIDNDAYVRAPVRDIAGAMLEDCGGQVDVSGELIRQVIARMLDKLLGCPVENHTAFSDALIAIGTMIFADPYGTRETRDEGRLGGRVMRPVIDNCTALAMEKLQKDPEGQAQPGFDGIIPEMARSLRRYQQRRAQDPGQRPFTDEDLRKDLEAIAYGMTTGFAVTHTFFTGIMATLGKKRGPFRRAVSLAQDIVAAREAGDAETELKKLNAFQQLLLEASRFQPAIQPGTFRMRTDVARSTMPGSSGLDRIPAGATVLACMTSAVMDPRGVARGCPHPRVFAPERLAADQLTSSLGFGSGLHHCLGAEQAITITSETLICLLSQPNIRYRDKRPKVKYVGVIPGELSMHFDPPTGALKQSQILAALPLDEACDVDVAMKTLKGIQDSKALADCYTASNIVHFASMNIAQLGKRGKERPHLLVELNVDGRRRVALERLRVFVSKDQEALADVGLILQLLAPEIRSQATEMDNAAAEFFEHVAAKALKLTELPWGSTGLGFVGTSEFSVRQIEREKKLADDVFSFLVSDVQKQIKAEHKKVDPPEANGPDAGQDETPANSKDSATVFFHKAKEKFHKDKDYQDLFLRLPGRGPAFARSKQVSFRQYLFRYAKQKPVKIIAGIWVLLPLAALVWGKFCGCGWGVWPFVALWVTPLLLLITVLIGLLLWLRSREARETQNPDRVDIERLRRIRASEERVDHAQTHITSVSAFKLGLFRRLTFSLAMHVVKSFARLWFRPGFLTDFATIHYARWVRIKGTDQLIFQSNYDGSWESYLEDFITKVHQGQTLAWNNAEGFPKTNWLWFDGARDGDRFKRWVRNQQIETPFWYSRFPDLTIPQIQMNALVRDGLARASDVSDHRAWLKLFGSVPRNGTELEADQVQSIVFNPHGRHELSACVAVSLGDPQKARQWLTRALHESVNMASAGNGYQAAGKADELPYPLLSFGDGEPGEAAMFIALSAGGLAKLGLSDEAQSGLNSFPSAFLDGMSGRAAALDDPNRVFWADTGWKSDPQQDNQKVRNPVDAVILIYMRRPAQMLAKDPKGTILNSVTLEPVREKFLSDLAHFDIKEEVIVDLSRDPETGRTMGGFGFHEGASQPVIKGTRWAAKRGVLERDILPPGEFILGYEDLRGYVSPAVEVREDLAARTCLPHSAEPRPEPYPYFADPDRGHMFDFGRNGSFLVIRQLRHTKGRQSQAGKSSPAYNGGAQPSRFDDFVGNQAEELAKQLEEDGSILFSYRLFTSGLVQDKDAWLDVEWNRESAQIWGRTSEDGLGPYYTMARTPMGQFESQTKLIYSAERTFLKELIRAKMIGRWQDGSSLVRHPLLSATGLLRRRTLRELEVLVTGEEFQSILAKAAQGEDVAVFRDRLLWEDQLWDHFVSHMRRFAEGLIDAPDMRIGILSHKWLRQSLEWPSVADNDFNFGRDDPQGLACPIGSHIRRSNPRDTPNPDNPTQFDLNNRHRIIRRGRTFRTQDSNEAKGTHFMCLNADIERQYEFIQRTWLNAPDFQGLVKQPDPIAAPHKLGDRFIIPHTSNLTALEYASSGKGPDGAPRDPLDFTTLIGGGYFFLPSRAALAYLAHSDRKSRWSEPAEP